MVYVFCVWLLPLSTVISGLTGGIARVSSSFLCIAKEYSILQSYCILSVHQLTDISVVSRREVTCIHRIWCWESWEGAVEWSESE